MGNRQQKILSQLDSQISRIMQIERDFAQQGLKIDLNKITIEANNKRIAEAKKIGVK